MCLFEIYSKWPQTSKQADKHTHAPAQCSLTSMGFAQAHPNHPISYLVKLCQVCRAIHRVWRAIHKVYRAIHRVYRATQRVYRATHRVYRATHRVYRAIDRVYRATVASTQEKGHDTTI